MRYGAVLVAVAILMVSACSSRDRDVTGGSVAQPPAIRVAGDPNTIPAGTQLEVRTHEGISSSQGEGRTYNGQIETDVIGDDGKILLPRGARVELVVMEAKEKSGAGGAGLRLGMRSVTVNGQTYLVISEEVHRTSGLGKNRGTAIKMGGGAALGSAIGAAAGGGGGALIGGLAGAAAGALAQVLTAGKEVKIPAETVVKFKLDEPIVLQPVSVQPASKVP